MDLEVAGGNALMSLCCVLKLQAIHGFRETERQHWYPHNKAVLDRVAQIAFAGSIMPYIHVLDLAENGVIKAHVDSSRVSWGICKADVVMREWFRGDNRSNAIVHSIQYCGTTIAGLSLLSDCVMRLVRTDEKRYVQQREGSASPDEYRSLSKDGDAATSSTDGAQHYVDVLLKRRSLYIMKYVVGFCCRQQYTYFFFICLSHRDTARYNFTHEILGNEHSVFKNVLVPKTRRISVICRNKP